MKLSLIVLVVGLAGTAVAAGQNVQSIQMAPVAKPELQAAQVDEQALAMHKLENENRKLREANERLRQENQALNERVTQFSSLGGSEVHAYCPDPGTSRNTAGAETDCRAEGGYNCEPVSGLCRTSCQTSDMCAGGYTCDTGTQQCVNTSGG